jgi:predicted metal-dependent peptidase
MADLNKAKKRMDKIVVNWFVQDPMLLGAWSLVEKIPDKNTKTIGIDTRSQPPQILFNPNFINSLNDEVLEHILANQCFKLLLRHPTTRLKKPKEVASLSSDVTVNQMAMKNLPNIDGIFDVIPMPDKFKLEKNQWFEKYFRDLMDKLEESNEQVNKMFGEKGQGQSQPGQGQSGEGDEDGEGEGGGQSGDGDSEGEGQSSGNGENQDSDKDEDGYPKVGSQKDAIKEMMDPRGDTNKNWGENDVFDADVQNMVNERKGSSKMWGKFSADFMNDIVAANTPKISWKEIIRRFNTSVVTTNTVSTRKKANRRFDLDAPGRRRVYTTKIIFAVDVSGSMSDDDLAEGFAVINSVCRHAEIEYVLFDTEIKLVEKKMKKAKDKFKIKGRGGTDFEMMCRYADKNKADGMIIFTDGYAPAPNPPKSCKVLWLLTNKQNKPPVDWGFVAHLDRAES